MTRSMYLPEAETEASLLRHLLAGHDIDPVLASMDAAHPVVANDVIAEGETNPIELALAWIDSRIPVSLSVYVNDQRQPVTCDGVRGGLVFLRIPGSMLRAGPNRLVYFIHFWTGGWKYQLWVRTASERRRLSDGEDSSPEPKPDLVNGETEVVP